MRTRLLAAAALMAATAACGALHRSTKEKIPMAIQEWKGQYGGPTEAGSAVAEDQGAWERAWKKVGKHAPPADFSNNVGVLVFVGEKPTGGWTVAFDEPEARGDDLVVRYRIRKPEGFSTQAFAQPWKARLFPKPKGKVIVEAAPE